MPGALLLRRSRLRPSMTFLGLVLIGALGFMNTGCMSDSFSPTLAVTRPRFGGKIHGGQQPVSQSKIQLYAISTQGDGAASVPLLANSVLTDANGQFTVDSYTCPSPSSQLYIVSVGGNPGLYPGANNPNLAELALLGPCSSVTASTVVMINEVTTVAGVYAMAPFMQTYASIGSGSGDAGALNDAVTFARELADTTTGLSPGQAVPAGQVVPVQKLLALANIVAGCVNSLGGVAGDGSACGNLFAYPRVTGTPPPADTAQAVLYIAQNPTWNVAQIFSLSGWIAPFQPSLTATPVDWNLSITSATPTPVISPVSGNYDLTPMVTITDLSTAAHIFYTTDGSMPTLSSLQYTGPLAMPSSTVVRAIALASGSVSLPAQASYNVSPAHLVFLTGPTTTVSGAGMNPGVTVAVENGSGTIVPNYTGPITVQLGNHPTGATLAGTVTLNAANGRATFSNLSIGAAGSGYTLTASYPGLSTITSTTFTITSPTPASMTYYLSPTGSDANDGSSLNSAWLSPNHNIRCGDTIVAAASTAYSSGNFGFGKWGSVNCPSGNNVAWLKCAVFDACKITVPANTQAFGMNVTSSYWGVQGWEISSPGLLSNGLSCFNASPANNNATIHHIIFANNVASTCPLAGFGMGTVYNGTASVDYYVAVGNISYNAGTSNTGCGSGIDIYMPAVSDVAAGTHIYVAGNFVWSTANPPNCWDGNGIILDTFDGNYTEPVSYAQQAVIENNISISNAGVGVRVEYNNSGYGPTHAPVYVRHNTMWNNSTGQYQFGSPNCGELQLYKTQNTTVTKNMAATAQPGCYGAFWNPNSAYSVNESDGTNTVADNVGWSDYGYFSQIISASGFNFSANNLFGTNPFYTGPATPSAPNCGSFSSAPNCMAKLVANFQPTNQLTTGYGYQRPSGTPVLDALFPKWVCNVNLPAGLITMGCL